LQNVVIENRGYETLIPQYDTAETLFYLDPPYVMATRGKKDAYQYEMPDGMHHRLLSLIRNVKGKVILSGYKNQLYDDALEGWFSTEKAGMSTTRIHAPSKSATEVLWMNFNPAMFLAAA
jgi:DNA adenine methylase